MKLNYKICYLITALAFVSSGVVYFIVRNILLNQQVSSEEYRSINMALSLVSLSDLIVGIVFFGIGKYLSSKE